MDILGTYSKHQRPGKSTIALIEEAIRCREETLGGETPWRIRNTPRRRVRALTEVEVDTLVAAYQAGASTYDLSRQLGIRRDTVTAHLERHGIMRRVNRRIELDDDTTAQVHARHAQGWSVHRISKEFGVTERIVNRTLQA